MLSWWAVVLMPDMTRNHFWIVCGVVVLGLIVYLIVCLSENHDRICHQNAYFGSAQLSIGFTHGAILVLLHKNLN